MQVKEFKVNLVEFPGGEGFYAVVPVDAQQKCNRCEFDPDPRTGENTNMRLLLFWTELINPRMFSAEIVCHDCGDALVEGHAQDRNSRK